MNGLNTEVRELINAGAEQISADELVYRLNQLGYEISGADSFNYFNGANKNKYPARHISIVEISTGISFANINRSQKDTSKLQALRMQVFVVNRGRLWEL